MISYIPKEWSPILISFDPYSIHLLDIISYSLEHNMSPTTKLWSSFLLSYNLLCSQAINFVLQNFDLLYSKDMILYMITHTPELWSSILNDKISFTSEHELLYSLALIWAMIAFTPEIWSPLQLSYDSYNPELKISFTPEHWSPVVLSNDLLCSWAMMSFIPQLWSSVLQSYDILYS